MPTESLAPADTIVLIHGLWTSPHTWDGWIERYVRDGYNVIAPAWPGLDDDIAHVPTETQSFSRADVTQVVEHHEQIIRNLDGPPIIMGHSFGGVFVHMLLERGLGCAGVAMDSGRDALNRSEAVGPIPKRLHGGARIRFGGALAKAKQQPVLRVESHRPGRAPLLFIAGGGERSVLGQEGWELIADYALAWATVNAIDARTRALAPR